MIDTSLKVARLLGSLSCNFSQSIILALNPAKQATVLQLMKPKSPPERSTPSPIPKLVYSIQIVPHTEADRTKIKREAKSRHLSLRDYCQDEIIGSMVLAEFE